MSSAELFGDVAFIVILALVIFVVVSLVRAVRIVPQSQAYVVERLGRYQAVMEGGFHLLVPFVDRVAARIDLREQVANFPPQPVITADQAMVSIDSVIYFQITDPRSATYASRSTSSCAVSSMRPRARGAFASPAWNSSRLSRRRECWPPWSSRSRLSAPSVRRF